MRYTYYESSLEPKTLPQALDNTSRTKAKPLELCLPCPLVLKVAVRFYGKIKTIAITLPYSSKLSWQKTFVIS